HLCDRVRQFGAGFPGARGGVIEIADRVPLFGFPVADQTVTVGVEGDIEGTGYRPGFPGHDRCLVRQLDDFGYLNSPRFMQSSTAVRSAVCSSLSTLSPYFSLTCTYWEIYPHRKLPGGR